MRKSGASMTARRLGRAARPAPACAPKPGAAFISLASRLGAEDAGQIADFLGDEEVVLHEALDMAQAAMRLVAEAFGELGLAVEAQAVLAAAR